MKRVFKIILIFLLIIFVLIQLIRPQKNLSNEISKNDITTLYHVPDNVQQILKIACNDCHSNNTIYPWYAEIQPVAWWLNDHVVEGKKELNFSEFAKYRIRRQWFKFDEIEKLVKSNVMPLPSYIWIHKNAILSRDQKLAIMGWARSLKDSLKANYPADSFAKKN